MRSHTARQRYWARSYLGYTPVQHAEANRTHYAISALQYLGVAPQLITQNVDRLHHQAAVSTSQQDAILELHGSLMHTRCLSCGNVASRTHVQEQLTEMNPIWARYAAQVAAAGESPSTNPDGDVDLQGRSYDNFRYPPCEACGKGPIKPAVVFFGENISNEVKTHAANLVREASALVVVGSALATYSAFRLVKAAVDADLPLCVLNLGPSRADDFFSESATSVANGRRLRFDLPSTDVLALTAAELARHASPSIDARTLHRLLSSGVTKAVDHVDEPAS